MALQTPLVLISGAFSTLPPGDTLGPSTDPVAQASGNAGISIGLTAQASGNAALVLAGTALASGNAGISTGLTALASGNAGLVSASNKVPISGGFMTGQLFAASGVIVSGTLTVGINSAAAPSLVFNGDPNTGILSPGADQLAISTGGTSRLAVSTTAVSSTLAVDVPLGASGTPSLTFTGDLNTGLFSPGADTLALVTAGTSRLHIASGGLVGLGTSSPTSPLTITQAASVDTGGSVNKWTAKFRDTTATAINVGGGLLFQGIKSAASGVGNFAGIAGLKENATDNNEDGYLAFSTTTNTTGLLVERARIDSSGRLLVNTTANANGGILQLSSGITFPATAVAATDVNTLDDYEEGTWTPLISSNGAGVTTFTSTTASGSYIKVGRLVTVNCVYTYSATPATNDFAFMSGLPFTSANNNILSIAQMELVQAVFDTRSYNAIILSNSSIIAFQYDNGEGFLYVGAPYMVNTSFVGAAMVRFTATYLAAT